MSCLLNCEEFDSFEYWISWVCRFLSLSDLVIESERLLIQTLTQNFTNHEGKKMILDFCHLLNCSNCLLCFLWICTMIWFFSSLPKEKKKPLTCATFGILCFNGFALCPVFLRDNTTVSHVCATDLKISQLWVLLALRFIILGHAVCDSYSCISLLFEQGRPPPPLNVMLMVEKAMQLGELWELNQL